MTNPMPGLRAIQGVLETQTTLPSINRFDLLKNLKETLKAGSSESVFVVSPIEPDIGVNRALRQSVRTLRDKNETDPNIRGLLRAEADCDPDLEDRGLTLQTIHTILVKLAFGLWLDIENELGPDAPSSKIATDIKHLAYAYADRKRQSLERSEGLTAGGNVQPTDWLRRGTNAVTNLRHGNTVLDFIRMGAATPEAMDVTISSLPSALTLVLFARNAAANNAERKAYERYRKDHFGSDGDVTPSSLDKVLLGTFKNFVTSASQQFDHKRILLSITDYAFPPDSADTPNRDLQLRFLRTLSEIARETKGRVTFALATQSNLTDESSKILKKSGRFYELQTLSNEEARSLIGTIRQKVQDTDKSASAAFPVLDDALRWLLTKRDGGWKPWELFHWLETLIGDLIALRPQTVQGIIYENLPLLLGEAYDPAVVYERFFGTHVPSDNEKLFLLGLDAFRHVPRSVMNDTGRDLGLENAQITTLERKFFRQDNSLPKFVFCGLNQTTRDQLYRLPRLQDGLAARRDMLMRTMIDKLVEVSAKDAPPLDELEALVSSILTAFREWTASPDAADAFSSLSELLDGFLKLDEALRYRFHDHHRVRFLRSFTSAFAQSVWLKLPEDMGAPETAIALFPSEAQPVRVAPARCRAVWRQRYKIFLLLQSIASTSRRHLAWQDLESHARITHQILNFGKILDEEDPALEAWSRELKEKTARGTPVAERLDTISQITQSTQTDDLKRYAEPILAVALYGIVKPRVYDTSLNLKGLRVDLSKRLTSIRDNFNDGPADDLRKIWVYRWLLRLYLYFQRKENVYTPDDITVLLEIRGILQTNSQVFAICTEELLRLNIRLAIKKQDEPGDHSQLDQPAVQYLEDSAQDLLRVYDGLTEHVGDLADLRIVQLARLVLRLQRKRRERSEKGRATGVEFGAEFEGEIRAKFDDIVYAGLDASWMGDSVALRGIYRELCELESNHSYVIHLAGRLSDGAHMPIEVIAALPQNRTRLSRLLGNRKRPASRHRIKAELARAQAVREMEDDFDIFLWEIRKDQPSFESVQRECVTRLSMTDDPEEIVTAIACAMTQSKSQDMREKFAKFVQAYFIWNTDLSRNVLAILGLPASETPGTPSHETQGLVVSANWAEAPSMRAIGTNDALVGFMLTDRATNEWNDALEDGVRVYARYVIKSVYRCIEHTKHGPDPLRSGPTSLHQDQTRGGRPQDAIWAVGLENGFVTAIRNVAVIPEKDERIAAVADALLDLVAGIGLSQKSLKNPINRWIVGNFEEVRSQTPPVDASDHDPYDAELAETYSDFTIVSQLGTHVLKSGYAAARDNRRLAEDGQTPALVGTRGLFRILPAVVVSDDGKRLLTLSQRLDDRNEVHPDGSSLRGMNGLFHFLPFHGSDQPALISELCFVRGDPQRGYHQRSFASSAFRNAVVECSSDQMKIINGQYTTGASGVLTETIKEVFRLFRLVFFERVPAELNLKAQDRTAIELQNFLDAFAEGFTILEVSGDNVVRLLVPEARLFEWKFHKDIAEAISSLFGFEVICRGFDETDEWVPMDVEESRERTKQFHVLA
ncbi:MAG: hypothetical protein AAGG56_17835 [Pseudomonadota bacterium]